MRRFMIELRAVLGSAGPWTLPRLAVVWLFTSGIGTHLALRLHCCSSHGFDPAAMAATFVFAMQAYGATFLLGIGAVVMLADLKGLCAPGRFPTWAVGAISAVVVVTVVIPAAVLALLQGSADPALIVASAALFGLLLVPMPRVLGAVLVLAPVVVLYLAAPLRQTLVRLLGTASPLLNAQLQLWLLAIFLAALVTWLWRPLLRGNAAALQSAARRAATWRRSARGRDSLAGWSDWWFPVASRGAVPSAPERIVRTCLGPIYTPWSRAGARLAVLTALPLVTLIVSFGWITGGWHRGWRFGVFYGLLLLWLVFGLQVNKALQHVNGELAELALIPGLGDRRTRLRALLQACVTTPLAIAVVVCALALLALRSEGLAPLASLSLLEWLGTTTLLGIAFMASILARRTTVWIDWAVMGCLAAVLSVWMVLHSAPVAQFSLPGSWAVLPVIASIILAANARRLASLPHPFIVR